SGGRLPFLSHHHHPHHPAPGIETSSAAGIETSAAAERRRPAGGVGREKQWEDEGNSGGREKQWEDEGNGGGRKKQAAAATSTLTPEMAMAMAAWSAAKRPKRNSDTSAAASPRPPSTTSRRCPRPPALLPPPAPHVLLPQAAVLTRPPSRHRRRLWPVGPRPSVAARTAAGSPRPPIAGPSSPYPASCASRRRRFGLLRLRHDGAQPGCRHRSQVAPPSPPAAGEREREWRGERGN
ncbi:Os06g0626766, partial [Oryza sativa Japonica Group]